MTKSSSFGGPGGAWLLVLAGVLVALAGCETNFAAPENTSAFSVTLDVQGTPNTPEGPETPNFVVGWGHLESGQNGSTPINPELTPKLVTPVPVGDVEIEMTEHPDNCAVSDARQQIRVVRSDTVSAGFSVECES